MQRFRRWGRIAYWTFGTSVFPLISAYADPAPPSVGTIQFVGSEAYLYDSNPLKLSHNSQSISGFDTSAALLLNSDTATSNFDTNTEIDNQSFDNSRYDSTNFHEKMKWDEKNERWQAGILGMVDYDTTRTSEIINYGINIPDVRHVGLKVSPNLDFTWNPQEKLSLTATALRGTYDNRAFTDYNFDSFYPVYSYHFDPLNTGTLTMNMQRYSTINGLSNTVDTYGPSVGWSTIINPNMTAKLSAGAEESTQSTSSLSGSTSRLNYVFSGDLSIKEQADTINLNASRNQVPFGNGNSALFTSFQASDTHAINEKLSLKAAASDGFAKYLEDVGVNLEKSMSGSAGIAYRIHRNLDIGAHYQYTDQTLTNGGGTVRDQVIMIGLSYHYMAGSL